MCHASITTPFNRIEGCQKIIEFCKPGPSYYMCRHVSQKNYSQKTKFPKPSWKFRGETTTRDYSEGIFNRRFISPLGWHYGHEKDPKRCINLSSCIPIWRPLFQAEFPEVLGLFQHCPLLLDISGFYMTYAGAILSKGKYLHGASGEMNRRYGFSKLQMWQPQFSAIYVFAPLLIMDKVKLSFPTFHHLLFLKSNICQSKAGQTVLRSLRMQWGNKFEYFQNA